MGVVQQGGADQVEGLGVLAPAGVAVLVHEAALEPGEVGLDDFALPVDRSEALRLGCGLRKSWLLRPLRGHVETDRAAR